jgi:hypothetical protein
MCETSGGLYNALEYPSRGILRSNPYNQEVRMKKFMILFIAGVLGAAMLTGCKGGDEGTTPTDAAAPKTDAAAPKTDAAAPKDDAAAPKTDATTTTTTTTPPAAGTAPGTPPTTTTTTKTPAAPPKAGDKK